MSKIFSWGICFKIGYTIYYTTAESNYMISHPQFQQNEDEMPKLQFNKCPVEDGCNSENVSIDVLKCPTLQQKQL